MSFYEARFPALAFIIALGAACYDPVHKDDVASLGDEVPGVPEGPLHRAGQHCTTCHGGDGPGSPEWSVAGTIYATRGLPDPAIGAQVIVTDKAGSQYISTTNAVGNFYVDKTVWNPIFPLRVSVQYDGVTRNMTSTIGRDGGCGACHRGVGDRHYAPQIFIKDK